MVPVVTVEALNLDMTQLQREVLRLHRRVQKLIALLRVLLVVFMISGYAFTPKRRTSDPWLAQKVLIAAMCLGLGRTFSHKRHPNQRP
jgi:hypothetical protein